MTALVWRTEAPPLRWTVIGLGLAIGAGVVIALSPVAVAAAAAAVGLAILAIRAPGVVLGLYIVVPPFFKAAVQPYSPIDVTVLLALLCVPQVIVPIVRGQMAWRAFFAWLALAALIAAGTLWSIGPDFAGSDASVWIGLAFLPLLAAFRVVTDHRQVALLLGVLVCSGLLVSLTGFASTTTDRLVVFEGDVIGTGRAAWIVPLVAIIALARGSRFAPFLLLALPAAATTGLASGARGPLLMFVVTIAMVAGAVVLVGRVPRARVAVSLVGVLGLAWVTVSLFGALLPEAGLLRFQSIVDVLSDPDAISQANGTLARAELWTTAIGAFASAPFLGIGTGGFARLLAGGANRFISGEQYPHNIFLQFGAEFGLVGIVVFAVILWLAFYRPPRGIVWESLTVLTLYFLLNAAVSSSIYSDRLTWGLLVVMMAAPRVSPCIPQAATSAATPSSRSSPTSPC